MLGVKWTRAVSIIALCMPLASTQAAGATPISAPGFSGGPRITAAGLMWMSAGGAMLGRSRLSRAGATGIPLTAPNSRWLVLDSKRGVHTEKLGSPSHGLAPLSRCPALEGGPPPAFAPEKLSLTAISGDRLFTVVDPQCLHRPGFGHAAILSESLANGSWKLLASVSAGALALSASGERLAVAAVLHDPSKKSERLVVSIYSARSGRQVYQVSGHSREAASDKPYGGGELLSLTASVDSLGDVLVSETHHGHHPGGPRSSGWWATPTRPHEHQLPEPLTSQAGLSTMRLAGSPPPTADAALSAGRLAYASDTRTGESIKLLDLRSGRARAVVHFRSELGVLGLDLSAGRLAWAQQSSLREGHSESTPDGFRRSECKVVVLSAPQLTSVQLDSIPATGLTVGREVPADTAPCAPEK